MRTSKKSTTVDYIVDITNAQSAADVYKTIAAAKLSQFEMNALIEDVTPQIYIVYEKCACCNCEQQPGIEKKPNIFKRFWNWVTGK